MRESRGTRTLFACICNAVRVSEVDEVIAAGARTVEDVGDACGAGTGCGTCVPTLCARLARAADGTISPALASVASVETVAV
jgi:bacterioferritin-associated ferredoxin